MSGRDNNTRKKAICQHCGSVNTTVFIVLGYASCTCQDCYRASGPVPNDPNHPNLQFREVIEPPEATL